MLGMITQRYIEDADGNPVKNLLVKGVTIENTYGGGIASGQYTNERIRVINCQILNTEIDGIQLTGDESIARGNTIIGAGDDSILVKRVDNIIVANNYIKKTSTVGKIGDTIRVLSDGTSPMEGILVQNNLCIGREIELDGSEGILRSVVANNVIRNSVGENEVALRIAGYNKQRLLISGNKITRAKGTGGEAIRLVTDNATGVEINSFVGNDVVDYENALSASGTGEVKNLWVTSNFFAVSGYGFTIDDTVATNYHKVAFNAKLKNVSGLTGNNTIVRNNLDYVTEDSGTATILSGNTSVTVSHGLDRTPSNDDFQVTPLENIGGKSVWVSGADSDSFVINVSSAVSDNRDFAWDAEVR